MAGDDVDGAVHPHEAGIIEDERVGLAGRPAQGAPNLLDVEAGALGRPQQGDEVDLGHIEPGGEHAHRGQAAQLARAEGPDDAVARPLRSLARGVSQA